MLSRIEPWPSGGGGDLEGSTMDIVYTRVWYVCIDVISTATLKDVEMDVSRQIRHIVSDHHQQL